VDAFGVARLVDGIEAVAGADAWADAVLLAAGHLRDQVRIGHLGAGHADQVDQSGGDGVAGGRYVRDPRRVHDRYPDRAPHLPGEREMGRGRGAHGRDHPGQAVVGVDVAAHDAQEVDAFGRQPPGRLDPVGHAQPVRQVVGDGQAQPEDELRPDRLAHRADHQGREAQPILERAAPPVVAVVGGRGQETVEQVPVRLDLDAVQAAGLAALGRLGVGGDDPADVPLLRLLGRGPVGPLLERRGREHGEPVAAVVARPAP